MAAGYLRHSSFYELLRRASLTDFSFINMLQVSQCASVNEKDSRRLKVIISAKYVIITSCAAWLRFPWNSRLEHHHYTILLTSKIVLICLILSSKKPCCIKLTPSN